jgi:hypothetical protein
LNQLDFQLIRLGERWLASAQECYSQHGKEVDFPHVLG